MNQTESATVPRPRFALLVAASLALGACHQPQVDPNAATTENFRNGMLAYLKARGDLCLGKYEFPIDVSAHQIQLATRDALQMPALEQAGLVSSCKAMGETKTEEGPVPTPVHRYQLTEAGRRYYLAREVPGQLGKNGKKIMRADLCAAKLRLDKIVGFELSRGLDHVSAVVTYTYQVEAAPWTKEPQIRQVFPAVAQVVLGAGSAQLKEGFTLGERGWVANELAASNTEPVANR
jgi:hypothetical protein